MHIRQAAVTAIWLAHAVRGQTSTDCNPTEKTCPSDDGLSTSSASVDFTSGASADWTVTNGAVGYSSSGAAFTINKQGDAPTIQTNFYIFFGSVSVVMRSAPGTGIVSSAILESDDLDEIDWEWLGGAAGEVQTNYFGKGNTTTYDRGTTVGVPGGNAESTSHNYTIVWNKEQTIWYIDGSPVRTLAYADAVGGKNYPQTPMRIRLGIWAGGDSNNPPGTIEWAGGVTDYSQGPFTMFVERVDITNFNPAASYSFGDQSGSWESIQIDGAAAGGSGTDETSGSKSSSSVGRRSTAIAIASGADSTTTDSPSTSTSTSSSTNSATSSTGTGGAGGIGNGNSSVTSSPSGTTNSAGSSVTGQTSSQTGSASSSTAVSVSGAYGWRAVSRPSKITVVLGAGSIALFLGYSL
ncbi:glycoside hydrolase family 16 protein [Phialemonium atrogriseum]|uniref:Crh-like protein n=1 Tax=Phialemonium atrogriseum TaxID=1093897 RepID=A0AAJ0FJ12_9PEZI|nr:glycoside hydrolase family 16 protein [Phialemonium atrogriseum]KAK1763874.1 glycoside hydrolase family 16 protein [Phialemonium atrogriseum]